MTACVNYAISLSFFSLNGLSGGQGQVVQRLIKLILG